MSNNKGPTVVSVINLKGGVGKTTLATLLARHASGRYGLNVLAVDIDPQANLSQALLGQRRYVKFFEEEKPSIVELFNGFASPSQAKPGPSKLRVEDVLQQVGPPAKKERLEVLPSRFDFSNRLIDDIAGFDGRILAKFIAQHMGHKDLILIDCAPTESILTRTAYHASGYILIPAKTEIFSTIGFPLLKQSLDNFRKDHGRTIAVKGVLINRSYSSGDRPGPHDAASERDIITRAGEYGWPVLREKMHFSRGYPKLMVSSWPSHGGNADWEYPNIANEILRGLGFEKS